MTNKLKIIYFGSAGKLSIAPFLALLQSQHEVVAAVVNDTLSSDIQMISIGQHDKLESVAIENNIQILRLKPADSVLIEQITELQPDVIVTSCFEKRIPETILSISRIASLNIHPSLLPRFRGPSPLFWQLREGVKNTGITIHLMTREFDAGDVVAQKSFELRLFATYDELKNALASLASQLLIDVLKDVKLCVSNAKAQDESIATYYSRYHIKKT